MNAGVRRVYFTKVWPAAAAALGVAKNDNAARHAATRTAMRDVGGPDTESVTALGDAEITALFTYLHWVAAPDDLRRLSAWMSCKEDYITYNRLLQARWWAGKAGYRAKGRIDRDRFGSRPNDGLFDEARMSAEEADQYLLTMRARAKTKARKQASSNNPF